MPVAAHVKQRLVVACVPFGGVRPALWLHRLGGQLQLQSLVFLLFSHALPLQARALRCPLYL